MVSFVVFCLLFCLSFTLVVFIAMLLVIGLIIVCLVDLFYVCYVLNVNSIVSNCFFLFCIHYYYLNVMLAIGHWYCFLSCAVLIAVSRC